MLEQDITEKRKERHKITQEDFTPPEIVSLLCNGSEELFTDFSKTVCDPCCGIGNIILFILRKRFENCKTQSDCEHAIESVYGTELMDDNTDECKERIKELIKEFNFEITDTINNIINTNIVCSDTFKWDYENWCPIKESKCDALF